MILTFCFGWQQRDDDDGPTAFPTVSGALPDPCCCATRSPAAVVVVVGTRKINLHCYYYCHWLGDVAGGTDDPWGVLTVAATRRNPASVECRSHLLCCAAAAAD